MPDVMCRVVYCMCVCTRCAVSCVAGGYPEHITVVGFSFKRARFVELHRAALSYPESQFAYVGSDPLDASAAALARLRQLEYDNSYRHFQADPFGCKRTLAIKKNSRNPFRRRHSGYAMSCPELRPLLLRCSHAARSNQSLPWTHMA